MDRVRSNSSCKLRDRLIASGCGMFLMSIWKMLLVDGVVESSWYCEESGMCGRSKRRGKRRGDGQ